MVVKIWSFDDWPNVKFTKWIGAIFNGVQEPLFLRRKKKRKTQKKTQSANIIVEN